MGPSADKLKGTQWKDAIPLEQKALQALLRAEATFRQIEVAFGQRGGGGGGGGSTGRDLASLFDLELDTQKNQYESAQSASPAEQHQKDVADALEKLDALAKRQEDLANQPNNPQQSFQERWQQEMLRRQAEELERQMQQQLAQANQQKGAQSQSGASSSFFAAAECAAAECIPTERISTERFPAERFATEFEQFFRFVFGTVQRSARRIFARGGAGFERHCGAEQFAVFRWQLGRPKLGIE